MLDTTMINLLVQRVKATKRINIHNDQVIGETLTKIFQYISLFNNLPELTVTTFAEGRPLDQIEVIDEFADFIYPEAVRLDPTDLRTDNLIVRNPQSEMPADYTYLDWLNLQMTFRSWYKSGFSDGVKSLASLRSPKSLMDALPIGSFKKEDGENDIRALDDVFIPLPLKPELAVIYRKDYLNSTTDAMIIDWIARFMK